MRVFVRVILAGSLVLGMTSCGAPDPARDVASVPTTGTSAAANGQPGDGGADPFGRCMRENGADGGTSLDGNGSNGTVSPGTRSPDEQRRQAEALEKCGKYLPDGGKPKPLTPEALEQGRKFAKCMREQGIAFPDPDPNTGGYQAQPGAVVEPVPPGVNVDDPAVRAKYDKCSQAAGGAAATVVPTR
jgi:hypothetical protein